MTLEEVQEAIESELVAIVKSAWSVTKVFTSPKETETALGDLPQAFLVLLGAEPTDDDEGSLCSGSARLQWAVLLHAPKPATGTLAREKRAKAQALRSEIAATPISNTPEVRWEGEVYDAREDAEVEATDGAYLLRIRFSSFVEWED